MVKQSAMVRVTEFTEAEIRLTVMEYRVSYSRHSETKFLAMSARAMTPRTRSKIFSFLFIKDANGDSTPDKAKSQRQAFKAATVTAIYY
jgi:hypothetical protein